MITFSDDYVDDHILTWEDTESARGPGWYEAECEVCGRTTSGYEDVVEDWAYEHVEEEHPRQKDYNGTTPTPAEEPMTTTESPDTPLHHTVSGQETTSEIELAEGRALYQYYRDVLDGSVRNYLNKPGPHTDWTDIGAHAQEAWIELAKRINGWVSGTSSNPIPVLAQKSLEAAHRRTSTIHDSFLVTSWTAGRMVDEDGNPKKVGSHKPAGEEAWGAVVNDHFLATTASDTKDEEKTFVLDKAELKFPKPDSRVPYIGDIAEHAKKVVELNTEAPKAEPEPDVETLGPAPKKRRGGIRRFIPGWL